MAAARQNEMNESITVLAITTLVPVERFDLDNEIPLRLVGNDHLVPVRTKFPGNTFRSAEEPLSVNAYQHQRMRPQYLEHCLNRVAAEIDVRFEFCFRKHRRGKIRDSPACEV